MDAIVAKRLISTDSYAQFTGEIMTRAKPSDLSLRALSLPRDVRP
jgi:hypothetical protein